jgi:hypothetical protein
MNAAEWLFSIYLCTAIVAFGGGYCLGYATGLARTKPRSNLNRYRYDRDGDTSQCK